MGENYTTDTIVAHSEGKIIKIQNGYGNLKGSTGEIAYGNYIKISHGNDFYTLYAHLQNGINLKEGQNVKKGDILGAMSDSGNAYGKHLHFEVWKNNEKINPTPYINKDLTINNIHDENQKLKYLVGDTVKINGVYISSTSTQKLNPAITTGKITKIIQNVNNPYLLEDGKIGWTNERYIVEKINEKYLSNKNYKGTSIVDALNEIKIDSSYKNRAEIAKKNNINNYKGTAEQNTKLLNLLKSGILKY